MCACSFEHDLPVLIKVELKPQGRLLMEARYFLEKKGKSVLHTQLHTHTPDHIQVQSMGTPLMFSHLSYFKLLLLSPCLKVIYFYSFVLLI